MRLALALACVLVAPLLASCSTDVAKRVPSNQVATSTGEAGEAAALISRYRVAQGLSPVTADPRLSKAAEVQARAVAEAGELSHGAFATRMASLGIGGASAENLTAGRRSVAAAMGQRGRALAAGVRCRHPGRRRFKDRSAGRGHCERVAG